MGDLFTQSSPGTGLRLRCHPLAWAVLDLGVTHGESGPWPGVTHGSLDWFMGKLRANPRLNGKNWWFPVDLPSNQSNECKKEMLWIHKIHLYLLFISKAEVSEAERIIQQKCKKMQKVYTGARSISKPFGALPKTLGFEWNRGKGISKIQFQLNPVAGQGESPMPSLTIFGDEAEDEKNSDSVESSVVDQLSVRRVVHVKWVWLIENLIGISIRLRWPFPATSQKKND